jgi:hypothetical protein
MSDFQIEEEPRNSFKSRAILAEARAPKLVQLLLKTKIVKDEKQAGNILIGVILICLCISAYFMYKTFNPGESVPKYIEDLPVFMREVPEYKNLPSKNI